MSSDGVIPCNTQAILWAVKAAGFPSRSPLHRVHIMYTISRIPLPRGVDTITVSQLALVVFKLSMFKKALS